MAENIVRICIFKRVSILNEDKKTHKIVCVLYLHSMDWVDP